MNGTDTGGRLTEWGIAFVWPNEGTSTFGGFGRILFGDTLWRYYPPVCRDVLAGGELCAVHLTPLYGFLVGLILLVIALWALRRSKSPGYAFAQFALWYSVLRSVIEEPFRDNPLFWNIYLNNYAGIGGFTLTQLASIPIILVAIYALLIIRSKRAVRQE
jgi:phosphatidylglycerol:prolipoprotein diacylglycerol transferase